MKPTDEEIEGVLKEENAALMQFATAQRRSTRVELQVRAARKRLSLARGAKWAIMSDLMMYEKNYTGGR